MNAIPDLDEWVREIKSDDPWTFEDAFHGPWPTGPAVIPRLLLEMRQANDRYTRGKFIELLGEMGNSDVVPYLVEELSNADQTIRTRAMTALETIGGDVAKEALTRHHREHPEDF